jgi:hypothetical protein
MYNLFVYSSQVHHIYKGIVFERKCHRMRVTRINISNISHCKSEVTYSDIMI